jgi:membrane protease YdiL (CAAX protease family)
MTDPTVLPARPPETPKRWLFWGTLAWTVVLLAAMAAVGIGLLAIVAHGYGLGLGEAAAATARFNPVWLASLDSIALLVPQALLLLLAARLRGWSFADYLGLRLPSRRHLLIGMSATAALVLVFDILSWVMRWPLTPGGFVEGLKRDPTLTTVLLMWVSMTMTAPIGEELVFRGFIYPGFAASRLGPVLAVALLSIMFTSLHVQYDALGLTQVFAIGMLLGIMRAWSGSTVLTIAMHSLVNTIALVEVVVAARLVD